MRRSACISSMILMMMTISIARSQTNTWEIQETGTARWFHGVHFVSSSVGWAVGDSGAIYMSTNGGVNWKAQSSGVADPLNAVDFINSDTGLAVGGCSGCTGGVVLKTTDGGKNWMIKDNGRGLQSVDFVSPAVAYAAGFNGLILKSTDGGGSWYQ